MRDPEALIESAVVGLRRILAALIGGVLAFSAIIVVLESRGQTVRGQPVESALPIVVPVFALVCATAFRLFERTQAKRLRKRLAIMSAEQVLGAYRAKTLVGAALAESVALLSGIAFLLDGSAWLLVGIGAAVLVMIAFLPSEQKLREFFAATSRKF